MKTVTLNDETWKMLTNIKTEKGFKTIDDVINNKFKENKNGKSKK